MAGKPERLAELEQIRAEDAEEEPLSPSDEDDAAEAADIPDPFTDESAASDDE